MMTEALSSPHPGRVFAVSPADEAPVSWAETRRLIRSDFERVVDTMGGQRSLGRVLYWSLLPSRQALLWYRIGRHLYLRGWRNTSWLIFLAATYVTRIEIPPTTAIGHSCFLGHAPIVLCGRIGHHFTHFGDGGMGGGIEQKDIGGGPDLPVIGDHVMCAIRSLVLGPVHVGDRAQLGPSCTVTRDVPAGSVVAAAPSRILRSASAPAEAPDTPDNTPESPAPRHRADTTEEVRA